MSNDRREFRLLSFPFGNERLPTTPYPQGLVDEANTKARAGPARRFARYPFDARINVHAFRNGENVDVWGRSTEIGLDGIGGTLTGELDPGEVVTMELPLPLTPYPLKLRAVVRYRYGLRHGFEFLAISQSDRGALERVCEMLKVST